MKIEKIHPAWRILFCCCVIQAGTIGTALCASMFYVPVSQTLGIPLGTFTLYVTVQGITGVIAAPLLGKLMQKISEKLLMAIAILLYGTSWLLAAFAYEMILWYLIGLMRGIAIPMFMLFIPVVVRNWFHKKQGMALGIATACTGFSGSLVNVAVSWLMIQSGWREAAAFCGVFCLCLAFVTLCAGVVVEP